jgi:hypothetical protein
MQTEEHNNGQISPPSVPKTGPYLQTTIKVVLGCQMINGINPRSAIRQQQHIYLHIYLLLHNFNYIYIKCIIYIIKITQRTCEV